MRFVWKAFALLLLVLWPAVTSHAFLHQVELMHDIANPHHTEGHPHEHHIFPDGDYTFTSAAKALTKPDSSARTTWFEFAFNSSSAVDVRVDPLGPAPPGTAPPELQQSRHFLLRTALLVRAPSPVSQRSC